MASFNEQLLLEKSKKIEVQIDLSNLLSEDILRTIERGKVS